MTDVPLDPAPRPKAGWLRRLAPFVVLAVVLLLAWRLGVTRYLSLEALQTHEAQLAAYRAAHPVLCLLGYLGLYVLVVVFSIPGALIMTMTGGLLFGAKLGAVAAVTAATVGATITFLFGRSALGGALRSRAGDGVVGRLMDGFERNAASYLLTLRLIPGIPFFAINLAAGLVQMRMLTYVLITIIGIAPGSFIYASIGSTLVTVFARGETPDLSIMLEPHVIGPLLGLAALAVLPILYRAWRAHQARLAS